jgi:hypothetical protein
MGLELILVRIVEGGGGWIHLAQDRDRLLALVDAVMNLRVPAPRR